MSRNLWTVTTNLAIWENPRPMHEGLCVAGLSVHAHITPLRRTFATNIDKQTELFSSSAPQGIAANGIQKFYSNTWWILVKICYKLRKLRRKHVYSPPNQRSIITLLITCLFILHSDTQRNMATASISLGPFLSKGIVDTWGNTSTDLRWDF